jgi:hypothetical protein
LPEGLRVLDCRLAPLKTKVLKGRTSDYRLSIHGNEFEPEKLAAFAGSSEFFFTRSNRKGKLKKINLKDMVVNIELLDARQLQVSLAAETGKTLRPAQILGPIFNLSDNQIKQARIVKLKTTAQNGVLPYV